jgi:hypothetical protein
MTTALDLMKLALKDLGALGIGQSISPDDTQDSLNTLNQMLAQWQGERLSVYHLINVAKQSTGAAAYTIGPGGDFDCARPTDIKAAFARLSNGSIPADSPVQVIRSREDYDRIVVKNLSTLPSAVFYDSAYPLGQLIWYPVPPAQYELHVSVLDALPQFATPSDDVVLPPEYLLAIRYNLAICMAPSYQVEPTPTLQRLAANAKRVIKRMNLQLPSMTMPAGLAGVGGRYNIYSDNFTR